MKDYYERHLAGVRLARCYELAPPRIRRYLDAEIEFLLDVVRDRARVLELGCGYGRVMKRLSPSAATVVGCDVSQASLDLAQSFLGPLRNIVLVRADAVRMPFRAGIFDAVACVQNGISAFGVDRARLVAEAARVARPGGRILFSSYSPRVWEDRLDWFRIQAQAGLIGEIDEERTGDGTIVCKDGFRASTIGGDEFTHLFEGLGLRAAIQEVDGSSLFCIATR